MHITKRTPTVLLAGLLVCLAPALQALTTDPGSPVKRIPHADQLDAWQAINKRQLLVSLSSQHNYLVTLRQDCHTLKFNNNVGFSSSNNSIYAGFDYVTASGQRCFIQSISKLTPGETRAIRKS